MDYHQHARPDGIQSGTACQESCRNRDARLKPDLASFNVSAKLAVKSRGSAGTTPPLYRNETPHGACCSPDEKESVGGGAGCVGEVSISKFFRCGSR